MELGWSASSSSWDSVCCERIMRRESWRVDPNRRKDSIKWLWEFMFRRRSLFRKKATRNKCEECTTHNQLECHWNTAGLLMECSSYRDKGQLMKYNLIKSSFVKITNQDRWIEIANSLVIVYVMSIVGLTTTVSKDLWKAATVAGALKYVNNHCLLKLTYRKWLEEVKKGKTRRQGKRHPLLVNLFPFCRA